jgi:RNA polymerase-interacting CarD/CdnL/TRCF family regulator
MKFQPGDWVVHRVHGLGQIKAIEKRTLGGNETNYFMIQIGDLTVWVPADQNLNERLRSPASRSEFESLFSTLTSPPEKLPKDYRQRNQYLRELLRDGKADSLCKVIRDMSAFRHRQSWSEYDRDFMRRIQKTLIGEWSYVFSIDPSDAEAELQKMLAQNAQ